jgi:hypothetical protein
VVATGAEMRPEEIPGFADHAATISTPASMLGVRERFQRVRDDAKGGRPSRVLFLIPPNNKCTGPLYEIVLMFETWLRREDARLRPPGRLPTVRLCSPQGRHRDHLAAGQEDARHDRAMRFHAGEPFHAGLGWQTMEVGLKGMSAVLAD